MLRLKIEQFSGSCHLFIYYLTIPTEMDQSNTSLDTDEKTYLTIDARGTHIKVPTDVIFESPVIKALCQHKKPDESFYLNFDPKQVHELVDLLSGYKSTVSQECSMLMDYCGLKLEPNQITHITISARGTKIEVSTDFLKYKPIEEFYKTHLLSDVCPIDCDIVEIANFMRYLKGERYDITYEFIDLCTLLGFEYKPKYFEPVKIPEIIRGVYDCDGMILRIETSNRLVYVFTEETKYEEPFDADDPNTKPIVSCSYTYKYAGKIFFTQHSSTHQSIQFGPSVIIDEDIPDKYCPLSEELITEIIKDDFNIHDYLEVTLDDIF
jgi:hypothetical protein